MLVNWPYLNLNKFWSHRGPPEKPALASAWRRCTYLGHQDSSAIGFFICWLRLRPPDWSWTTMAWPWPTRWLVISGQHCVQALGTGAYQRRKHRASRCMAVVGFSMTYYAPRHLTVVVETCSKLISMHQSTWPSPFQLRWIILTFCGVSLGHWLTFSQGNLKIWTWSHRVKRNFKRRSHLTVSVWGQNLEDSVNGGDAVSS